MNQALPETPPVAVVTGAANGLGLGFATVLARQDMTVVLADIEAAALARAESGLLTAGHNAISAIVDLTVENEVNAFAAQSLARHGKVDVLCLNAGVSIAGHAWDLSVSDWRWVYDVNVFANVYALRAFLPAMIARDSGRVVFTVSNSAVTTIPQRAPYVSSKHALLSIAETVQRELESIGSGVRVAAVLPGAIRSTMADATRNRPAAYGRAEVPAEVRDAARAFLEQYGADPVAMADDVLRAVFADDRFYIFTGAEDLDMHRMRSEDIEAGRLRPLQPTEVPGS